MNRDRRGLTLVEILITVGLLGLVFVLTRFGIDFFNTLLRQGTTSAIRLEAQAVTYGIIRDIRNAKQIQEVSTTKLVLRSFDLHTFSYAQPDLFNPVNIGTTTYEIKSESGRIYISRQIEFPTIPGGISETKLLENKILMPNSSEYMFKGGPNLLPPFDTVEVNLYLKPAHANDEPLFYREVSLRRSGT